MPSKSTTYKFYFYNKILRASTIAESFYFNYKTKNCEYFIMLDFNLKYTKYIYLNYSYINIL